MFNIPKSLRPSLEGNITFLELLLMGFSVFVAIMVTHSLGAGSLGTGVSTIVPLIGGFALVWGFVALLRYEEDELTGLKIAIAGKQVDMTIVWLTFMTVIIVGPYWLIPLL